SNIFNVQGIGANPIPTINGNTSFCPGDSTILTTDNMNPAWKNQWYRNGILLPNDTSKTLVVKLQGDYTVTLKSPRGCISTSLATTVTLRPAPPVPSITGFSLICSGGNTILTSSAGLGNVWFLAGIQIPGANNPTYTATGPGSYTVLVTNEQGCRTESQPFQLNSTSAPQALATFENPTTCGGSNGQIQLSVTGGSGNFSFNWSPLAGGVVQGQQNQTALTAGNYSVLVTDENSGCSQVVQGIILNDPANFTVSAQVTNVTSCSGSNGQISLTTTGSNGPFAYSWSPVSGNGPVLSNVSAGYYAVQVTDLTSNCSVLLDSILVNSQAPPKPDILASGPLEFCSGDSIILTTTAEGPFQWATFPGGAIQNATSNSLVVKSSGNYYVRTANTGFPNCFSRSDTLTVTVNPLPSNPQISSSSTTVCSGITVSISTTSILFKQWLFNGNPIAGATGQFIDVSEAGTYCLKVTDGNGCSRIGTNCREVIVNPLPPLPIISGDSGFCPGSTARLTIAPFDSSLYQYTWMRNNQFIGNIDRDTITVNIGGWYKVRALNEATTCRVFSDSVFVKAFNNPPAPTITGPSALCPGGTGVLVATDASSYQWIQNGNPLDGQTGNTLSINQPGIYRVRIADSNGCTSLSPEFVVGTIPAP
ncbi:MAG TPA: SprB repeat-containing protein, partial [Catalimonadaceae bacterium]|nr:SprB repeat-containing protein [Catalimonadaceae bacterium]